MKVEQSAVGKKIVQRVEKLGGRVLNTGTRLTQSVHGMLESVARKFRIPEGWVMKAAKNKQGTVTFLCSRFTDILPHQHTLFGEYSKPSPVTAGPGVIRGEKVGQRAGEQFKIVSTAFLRKSDIRSIHQFKR